VKQPATSADTQTFQRVIGELVLVVDRIVREDVARRRALARELRARVKAADDELVRAG
jgi:hypothetical protein